MFYNIFIKRKCFRNINRCHFRNIIKCYLFILDNQIFPIRHLLLTSGGKLNSLGRFTKILIAFFQLALTDFYPMSSMLPQQHYARTQNPGVWCQGLVLSVTVTFWLGAVTWVRFFIYKMEISASLLSTW